MQGQEGAEYTFGSVDDLDPSEWQVRLERAGRALQAWCESNKRLRQRGVSAVKAPGARYMLEQEQRHVDCQERCMIHCDLLAKPCHPSTVELI